MKAAVYHETGAPDVFRYENVPDPQCRAGGVLIEVKAISIEGGDVLNRAGGEMPSRPHIVGYQCAGVIREVGENVSDRAAGVGLAAIQLAKRAGATVLATASSDEKLERLKEFGLDHGINYRTEDWVAKARALTGGRGVDLVVDSVGTTLPGGAQ